MEECVSNLLKINYKVQNIRKCKPKETLNRKLESDVMYSKIDICSVKIQSDANQVLWHDYTPPPPHHHHHTHLIEPIKPLLRF